jgi:CelD/BcsL family acetyltransferase involved in cellulose biosynthesis
MDLRARTPLWTPRSICAAVQRCCDEHRRRYSTYREGTALEVTVVKGGVLAPELHARWASLQEESPEFASPFFRPEFTASVAAVRDDVFIAQIRSAGVVAGFFPFQRTRLGFGYPVGGERSNYQGAIVDPGLEWDARSLIRASGLRAYAFHHMLASQRAFRSHQASRSPSSVIDVSGGYDAYLAGRRAAGSEIVAQTERKTRKLEREIGPVQFEAESTDRALLRLLMQWKSDQYIRTGLVDQFAIAWNVALIEHIHGTTGPHFGGALSVLRAGDRVAAVAFGMRSRDTWHYWFPTYDRALAPYSPGVTLLLRITQEAARRGMRVVDLGKDDAVYKARFRTGVIEVAEGQVVPSSSIAALVRFQTGCVALARQTPLAGPLRAAKRQLRLRAGRGARA